MAIDLFLGKRMQFEKAWFWRKKDTKDYSEIIYSEKAHFFTCKEETPQRNNDNVVGGAFMYRDSVVVISTYDNIAIELNDLVKFRNRFWIVKSIQEKEMQRQLQFGNYNNASKMTVLELRGKEISDE